LSGSETIADSEAESRLSTDWLNRMLRNTSALFDNASARSLFSRFGASDADDTESDEPPVSVSDDEPEVPRLGSFEVMNRTIDIAQAALARHTLAAYPPDLLIEVPRSACRSLEFHRAAEVIEVGRTLAAKALDDLDPTRATSPAIER